MTGRQGVLLLLALTLAPACAFGWGAEAHRIVTRSACLTLPQQTRPFFATCREFLAEHSNDPDTWKGDPEEKTRHFCDIDHYGKPPFAELPRDYQEAVRKFGADRAKKVGTLPWRIAEYTEKLSRSMRAQDWAKVRLDAAHLAHYVADAHMPFHCTVNYNGQLRGNLGIHGRLEIELVERYLNARYLATKPAAAVPDARAFAFQVVLESHRLTASLLEADTRVRAKAPLDTDLYYALLYRETGETIRGRMAEAATAVGSLWQSAWKRAGKPRMPPRRAVVILVDQERFDPAEMRATALRLLGAAAGPLGAHDAVALRLANAPKKRWQRGIAFQHAVDCAKADTASGAVSCTPGEEIGLQEAVAALRAFPNAERTLILLSDGLPQKVRFKKLAVELRQHRITLHCISVRPGAERQLRALSRHARGRFDAAKDLDRAGGLFGRQNRR